ncbi:NAD(P)/FAD-dependent oxidoreductase, partial [Streptomyces cahuitamycinicus]
MRTDLAVIGAGPAGLAAALAACARGVRVTLVDAATRTGGQFYRQPAAELGARRPEALHHGWRTWERLRDGLAAGAVRVLTDHHVWCVERTPDGFTLHTLLGPEQEEPVEVRARTVLLATGGYEQVLPFPGWTLPGVVTAGGAQAMLKGGLVVPGRRAVVAGTGPLLLPVATGLAAAGVEVAALVESADPQRLARHAPALARKLPEGAGYAVGLLRHRVPVLTRHTVVRAHGDDRLTGVTVAALDADGHVRPGTGRHLPCDTLAAGHGMLPHTDLAEGLGCRLDGLAVAVDTEQRTDVPGVWAAGEATGIGGAALALAEGHIAGCSAAAHLHGTAPG